MRKDRLLEDGEIKAMTRGPRRRRNAVLSLLTLLLIGNCVPWHQTFNLCYPVGDTVGLRGRYYDGGGLFRLWLELAAEDLDSSKGSASFWVSPEQLKAKAPNVVRLISPDSFERGWGLFGSVYTDQNLKSAARNWTQGARYFNVFDYYGMRAPGIWFVGGYRGWKQGPAEWLSEYALFSKEVVEPLTERDWDHFIGFCQKTPDQLYADTASTGVLSETCEMMVYAFGARATYYIDFDKVELFQHAHDFVRNQILCER